MPSLFPSPGPQLPHFRSLLIKGTYHPTAPIYLCMDCAAQSETSSAIVLSSSRQILADALEDYNDDWLSSHSGHGKYTGLSSRIHLLYPSTPAHLAVLLSMIQPPRSSDDCDTLLGPIISLGLPSIIVLHEISAYFLPGVESDPTSHPWTVSSYLTLITRTLAILTAISVSRISGDIGADTGQPPPISFAVFDSQIDRLRLPILKNPSINVQHYLQTDEDQPTSRAQPVFPLVQQYFEWTGVFDQDAPHANSTQNDEEMLVHLDGVSQKRLKLYTHGQVRKLSWTWFEKRSAQQYGDRQRTEFIWEP